MKYFLTALFSMILGIVLGGIAPRRELQKQKDEFWESYAENTKSSSTIGSDLALLMGGTNTGGSTTKQYQPPLHTNELGDRSPEAIKQENPEAAALAEEMDNTQSEMEANLQDSYDRTEEELETVRTALELRRSQARAALIENVQPSEEQLQSIDETVQTMNDTLIALAGDFADIIENGEEPDRRQIMSFAAEALDTMLSAENSMRDVLTEEQLMDIDEAALDPFSYVSPDIINTLQSLDQ